jgi:hypothetical protein
MILYMFYCGKKSKFVENVVFLPWCFVKLLQNLVSKFYFCRTSHVGITSNFTQEFLIFFT